jgi:hypothetical protein
MSAVSPFLIEAIKQLQKLPALEDAVLAGGTSLALRYDHRESVDIDLMFSDTIGKAAFQEIEKQVRDKFQGDIMALDYPCDIDDQFVFLRFLLRSNDEQIKVEIMQNMIFTEPIEEVDGIRILSRRDIGMLKLMAASNRCSFKDIYDLSYLTNEIPLPDLFGSLADKQHTYSDERHRNIFELDDESPVNNPLLLLAFDNEAPAKAGRPSHSTHQFKIINGNNWLSSKLDWRRKVRELFKELGTEFPGAGQ